MFTNLANYGAPPCTWELKHPAISGEERESAKLWLFIFPELGECWSYTQDFSTRIVKKPCFERSPFAIELPKEVAACSPLGIGLRGFGECDQKIWRFPSSHGVSAPNHSSHDHVTAWWFGTWLLFSIFFHFIYGNVIIPTDELTNSMIFQRGG